MTNASILKAAKFAAMFHINQRRKDKERTPYVNHCIKVAEVLERVGACDDAEVLQAALLHDTLEDTDANVPGLVMEFGWPVAHIVMEVTDDKSLPPAERKRLQIEHAPKLSPEAKQIKLADKLCNICDLSLEAPVGWPLKRKREYLDWAQRVVTALELPPDDPLLAMFFTIASQKVRELEVAELSGER